MTALPGDDLLVLCPLAIEARAVRGGLPGARVLRSGMGKQRSLAAARAVQSGRAPAIAVAGFCGGVDPRLRAGDIVVATEVRGDGRSMVCTTPQMLATVLRGRGARVALGVLASAERVTGPAERARLHAVGVAAVDMESAWLASAAAGRPFAVLRVVVDVAGQRLASARTLTSGIRAYRSLRLAAAGLGEWAGSCLDGRGVAQNRNDLNQI